MSIEDVVEIQPEEPRAAIGSADMFEESQGTTGSSSYMLTQKGAHSDCRVRATPRAPFELRHHSRQFRGSK